MSAKDEIRQRLLAGEQLTAGNWHGHKANFRAKLRQATDELSAQGITVIKTRLAKKPGQIGPPEIAYSIAPPRPKSSRHGDGTQRAEIQLRLKAGERIAPSEYSATVVIRAVRQMMTEGARLARDVEHDGTHGGAHSFYRLAREGEPALQLDQTHRIGRLALPSESVDPTLQEAARMASQPAQQPSRAPLRLLERSEPVLASPGPSNGSRSPQGAAPAIGSFLQVRGLQLEADGRLSVVLGDGSWLWAAELRGATPEPLHDD